MTIRHNLKGSYSLLTTKTQLTMVTRITEVREG